MARFRLRFLGREIDLPTGEFIIGRSAACSMQLDESMVSRRHACIRVAQDGVVLEDLSSRNGVLMNGVLLRRPTPLVPGDRVQIGRLEMVLVEAAPDMGATQPMRPAPIVREKHDGKSLLDPAQDPTASSSLMLDLADKALSMGRTEDAEWMVRKFVTDLQERLAAGQTVGPDTVDRTATYVLKLARATSSAAWLDRLFEVYRASEKVLPATLIDELHAVVRQLRYPANSALRRYVEAMRKTAASRPSADRFLAQRLEGLLEVASSHGPALR